MDVQPAAVLVDDSLHIRQPQPDTKALGAEQRLKNVRHDVLRDRAAFVVHFDARKPIVGMNAHCYGHTLR